MEYLEVFLKTAVSLFFVFMLILLMFWCLPKGYFFREILHIYFSKYICWAALDNYWALFAPQPVSKNFLIGFELEFESGQIKSWRLPEYSLKNGFQDAPHFRFIKLHNQLLSQHDDIPKEAMCNYIHRLYLRDSETEDKVIKIHILRFYETSQRFSLSDWLSQRIFTFST